MTLHSRRQGGEAVAKKRNKMRQQETARDSHNFHTLLSCNDVRIFWTATLPFATLVISPHTNTYTRARTSPSGSWSLFLFGIFMMRFLAPPLIYADDMNYARSHTHTHTQTHIYKCKHMCNLMRISCLASCSA